MKRINSSPVVLALVLVAILSAMPAWGEYLDWTNVSADYPGTIEVKDFSAFNTKIHVARMTRNSNNAFIHSSLAYGQYGSVINPRLEKIDAQSARYNGAISWWGSQWGDYTNRVVVAINGHANPSQNRGVIHDGWYVERFASPTAPSWTAIANSGFVFGKGDVLSDENKVGNCGGGQCVSHVEGEQLVYLVAGGGSSLLGRIRRINHPPQGSGEISIYTPQRQASAVCSGCYEVCVRMDKPAGLSSGTIAREGTVTWPAAPNGGGGGSGNRDIEFDSVVLQAEGTNVLNPLKAGDRVRIDQKIANSQCGCGDGYCGADVIDWTQVFTSIQGEAVLVKDGAPNDISQCSENVKNEKDARTVVAYDSSYVYFIVADKNTWGPLKGVSGSEMQTFCTSPNYLPVLYAVLMDGGDSSTMIVNGSRISQTTTISGEGRSRPSGLMMVNAVPARPKSTKYAVGNQVTFTIAADPRLGPGMNYGTSGFAPANSTAAIQQHTLNGQYASGMYWWYVKLASGTTRWVPESVTKLAGSQGGAVPDPYPAVGSACLGGQCQFQVNAGNVTYRWQKDGVDLSNGGYFAGTNSSTLQINGANTACNGHYRCKVTDANGTNYSSAAPFTVVPQVWVSPLASESAVIGGTAVFSVNALGSNLNYAWQKNGNWIYDDGHYFGTNTDMLQITGCTLNDEGDYRCRVESDCGTAFSQYASLTVSDTMPPSDLRFYDDFDNYLGGDHLRSAYTILGGHGGHTNKYHNYPDGVSGKAVHNFAECNNPPQSTACADRMSRYIGEVFADDDAPVELVFHMKILSSPPWVDRHWVQLGHTDEYQHISIGVCDYAMPSVGGRTQFNSYVGRVAYRPSTPSYMSSDGWFVLDGAPLQSEGWHEMKIVVRSNAADFYVDGVLGKADVPVYTTYWNGTSSYINTVNIGSGMAFRYNAFFDLVTVTGGFGDAPSPPGITEHPQDVEGCEGGQVDLHCEGADIGGASYNWYSLDRGRLGDDPDEADFVMAYDDTLHILNMDRSKEGYYYCEAKGNIGTVESAWARVSMRPSVAIASHPSPQAVCPGETATFTCIGTEDNLNYEWYRNGSWCGAGSTLIIPGVTANHAGAYVCHVTGPCANAYSEPALLTVYPVNFTRQPESIAACPNATVTFNVEVNCGSSVTSYQWVKSGVNLTNGGKYSGVNTSTLTISGVTAAEAAGYWCVATPVSGAAVTSHFGQLSLVSPPEVSAPDPTRRSFCSGQTVTFTVTATGTGTLSYQWQRRISNVWTNVTGARFSGMTTSVLTVTNVTAAEAGTYRCRVTQSTCSLSTVSAAKILEIDTAPGVLTQGLSAVVCPGQSCTLDVTFGGALPMTYQWQKNGVNLTNGGHYSGCTTPTLTIADADSTVVPGPYRCVATNCVGSAASENVAASLKVATAITSHPVSVNVAPGLNATFTVAATGDGPLAYQWQKGGVNITNGSDYSGCTAATLTVLSCSSADVGQYRCVVTSTCGSATSNAAALALGVTFLSQPPATLVTAPGYSVTIGVAAAGVGTLTYRWQQSSNGSSWGDLSDFPDFYTGTGTNSMTYTPTGADVKYFRCKVTDSTGSYYSTGCQVTACDNCM